VTPRFAIVGNLTTAFQVDPDAGEVAGRLQVGTSAWLWVASRLRIGGGLGLSRVTIDDGYGSTVSSSWSPALLTSLALEAVQWRTSSLDFRFDLNLVDHSYEDGYSGGATLIAALSAAFTWH
jgi:hypothetical protein